ncbi:MAG: cyclic nucleotide-binding domain-containing protein [Chloroflexi bacterium]|nr:cyclic nucleotide-binding domain-containing protein [Chloroflexota bacterium]
MANSGATVELKRDLPTVPRVVIVGGGFAGVAVAQELEKQLPRGAADVQLISKDNFFVFQPMLPEVAGGSIEAHHILNSLRQLCPHTTVSLGTVSSIDMDNKSLEFIHGTHEYHTTVPYDYLVLAFGSVTNFSELTGMAQHALGLKTVGDALYLRNHILSMLEEADVEVDPARRREMLTFVVVGGGFSGVETVAELNDFVRGATRFYSRIHPEDVRVVLVHAGARILPELSEELGAIAMKRLVQQDVDVRLNSMLGACTQSEAILKGGEEIATRTLVCTIGAAANPLLATTDCPKDERGRIKVNEFLEVEGRPEVWALGDCTAVPNQATGVLAPPTAQFAQREGKLVARNIAAAVKGQGSRESFHHPGLGQFVAVGRRFAVANVLGMNVSGFLAWWLWRSVYLMKLPGLSRKVRVAIDWTLDLVFGRDIVDMQLARADRVGRQHYEPGDFVLRQGEPVGLFYVIIEGEAEVARQLPDGTETVLAHLGTGDHFGEMALLQHRERHSASVRALTTLNVLTPGPGRLHRPGETLAKPAGCSRHGGSAAKVRGERPPARPLGPAAPDPRFPGWGPE